MKHHCVIILFSIHFVLKAEKILQAARVDFDVIPVPRTISSDCGMAIAFSCRDLNLVSDLLRREEISIARIYQRDETGTYREYGADD